MKTGFFRNIAIFVLILGFTFAISEFLFKNHFKKPIPPSVDNPITDITPTDETEDPALPDDEISNEPEPEEIPPEQKPEENILSTYSLPYEQDLTKFIDTFIEIAESQPTEPQDDKGRTKYGEVFGDPYAQWCTEFVMWCAKEADTLLGTNYIDTYIPWRDSAYRSVVWYKSKNKFMLKENYIPRRGDLVFFDYDYDENSDHTGLVTGVEYDEEEDKIYILTIEGNLPEDYPNGIIRTRRLASDNKKYTAMVYI